MGITFTLTGTPLPTLDRDVLSSIVRILRDRANDVAELVRQVWIQRAQDLGLTQDGGYIRGIEEGRVDVVADRSDDTSMMVTISIVNTAEHAAIVEDGHAAFHLPEAVSWSSPHVKHTKDGRPYLSIPFGHSATQSPAKQAASGITRGTLKSMMPAGIYARAKGLGYTTGRGSGPVLSGGGAAGAVYEQADVYSHGPGRHRLSHVAHAGLVALPSGDLYEFRRSARSIGRIAGREAVNPEWQNSKFHGMLKTGTKGHASYLTIRTMTIDSPGWNIPAQVGYGVARQVATYLRSPQGAAAIEEILTAPILEVVSR